MTLHVFGAAPDAEDAVAQKLLDDAPARCTARVVNHGAVAHSELWGRVSELQPCILIPTRLENEPMVILEVAQAGMPLLALDIPSIREMVRRPRNRRIAALARSTRHAPPHAHMRPHSIRTIHLEI